MAASHAYEAENRRIHGLRRGYLVSSFSIYTNTNRSVSPSPRWERQNEQLSLTLSNSRAIAAASTRLHYAVALSNSTDKTWYTWLMGMWGLVEMDVGFTVACLPATGAFWRNMHQSAFYASASRSLKGITSWKRMTDTGDSSDSYAMTKNQNLDPYLVVEGDQPLTQGISWVKSYGVSDMDIIHEPDVETGRGTAPGAGYHVSVDTGRPR